MTREEVNLIGKPWIKICIRRNSNECSCYNTEMFVIDYSDSYRGRVAGYPKGSHYDLGFLRIDADDGITIIING